MRYPQATWRPGPAHKQGYPSMTVNRMEGLINHSAEGPESSMWLVLDTYRESWQFSVMKDGRVFQHYDMEAVCYHAGTPLANYRLIGIEHEGKAGEPLTEPQIAASVELNRWIAKQAKWRMERGKTLWEHNQWTSTQCPSGRIPWERYTEEEDMAEYLPRAEYAYILEKQTEYLHNLTIRIAHLEKLAGSSEEEHARTEIEAMRAELERIREGLRQAGT